MGYYAVDNIPPELIPKLAELVTTVRPERQAALVVDCRQDGFFGGISQALRVLEDLKMGFDVLYLEADDPTLIRRYKESRRSHPLAPDGPVTEGIRRERERLEPIRRRATILLDTGDMSSHQFKEKLREIFGTPDSKRPTLRLVSFGFKHGILQEADILLDVRGLPNPHYHPELKPLPGNDPLVMDFVLKQETARRLVGRMEALLKEYLAHLGEEGRHELVVGIGCTGGRHRSVAIAEHLEHVLSAIYQPISVEHRDIEKEGTPSETSFGG